jgi:hypothetical protein
VLATSDPGLLERMEKFQAELADTARAKGDALRRRRAGHVGFGG